MKTPQESSRHRAGARLGVAAQIALALVLLVAVNYGAFHYYGRGDWSPGRKYQLADQTTRLLQQLPAPVVAYVFFSPTTAAPGFEVYDDVVNLLKEYQVAAGNKFTVEYIDPTRNLARARELQTKFGFGSGENLLILEMGGRSKQIIAADMADYDMMPQLTGDPPRVAAFKGEQSLTSALIALSEPKERKVYFLQGQGEPALGEGSKLSLLEEYIGRQGVVPAPLNVGQAGGIPDDTAALILVGPRYDLSETAMTILRDYWAKDGRLMILLDPASATPVLREFLSSLGVTAHDDRVLRTVQLGFATGILRDVSGQFAPGNRITRRLYGSEAMFPGGACSLGLDTSRQGTVIEPLITAEAPFWGETEYVTDENKGVAFDADKDTPAPLVLAAMLERGGVGDEKVGVSSARMMVTGNAEFVADGSITESNLDFVLSALNWMMDRSYLTGIAPKAVRAFKLNLTDVETGRIALYTLVVIPAAALIAGFFVWWRRRR